MALVAQETTASVASALRRPYAKGGQASTYSCGRIGSWLTSLRLANAIVALSATSAFAACFVLMADATENSEKSLLQETHQAAAAGAQKCWNSATAAAQLVEKGVVSPSVFSLEFPANDQRDTCSVLRARDATDDDCTMLVTVGGGGYFRLLYSGLYYVTVQVAVEAEAESGCIELVVARRRPRSGNVEGETSAKKVEKTRGRSCHGNGDSDASYETTLSTVKVTLPGDPAGDAATAKANTTLYTSKLVALLRGDDISLKLRCFGVGTLGAADSKTESCRLSVGRGSLLSAIPIEMSIN